MNDNKFAIFHSDYAMGTGSNLLAFNVRLMVSRGQPEHISLQLPLCEKYLELAKSCVLKASKAVSFFNELSILIFEDMKKAAVQKIQDVIEKGKIAEENIVGYSYIKQEISVIVKEITSISYEDITAKMFEDYLLKLEIRTCSHRRLSNV